MAFGTIGNASTSEGMFFEALNAAGVLQVPMLMSVWDDHYGISVPAEYQTTKQSISAILTGLQREGEGQSGFEIFVVRGWDYAGPARHLPARRRRVPRRSTCPCSSTSRS